MSSPPASPPPANGPRRRLVEAAVLAIWAALLAHTLTFVAHYASPIATRDDMELLPAFMHGSTFATILNHFWLPLNEHRIVLTQFIHFAAVSISHDFRAGCYVQVVLLALAALGCMLTARRLRGRTALEDAVFPLLFLTWGNGENLLLGMQICVALATLLATAAACAMVWSPGPPSVRRMLVVGACMVLLPWCGGFGLCQAPVFAVWLAVTGAFAWRAGRRAAVVTAAAGCAAFAGCIVLYFSDFAWPPQPPVERELGVGAGIVVQFLSMAFGGIAPYHPWVSLPAALLVLALALLCASSGLRGARERRWLAFGIATTTGGVLLLAASIGWSRQGSWPVAGWAGRYALAPTPMVVAAVFGAILFGGRWLARGVPIVLALVLAAVLPLQIEMGRWNAAQIEVMLAPFLEAVRADLTIEELARTYHGMIYPDEEGLRVRLGMLREARLPPFETAEIAPEVAESELAVEPFLIEAAAPLLDRRVNGLPVFGALAPARFSVALPADARYAAGRMGVLPIAYVVDTPPERHTLGVRARVLQEQPGKEPVELLRRELRPGEFQSDRGLQAYHVVLNPGGGRLLLVTECMSTERPGSDWFGWTRLSIH